MYLSATVRGRAVRVPLGHGVPAGNYLVTTGSTFASSLSDSVRFEDDFTKFFLLGFHSGMGFHVGSVNLLFSEDSNMFVGNFVPRPADDPILMSDDPGTLVVEPYLEHRRLFETSQLPDDSPFIPHTVVGWVNEGPVLSQFVRAILDELGGRDDVLTHFEDDLFPRYRVRGRIVVGCTCGAGWIPNTLVVTCWSGKNCAPVRHTGFGTTIEILEPNFRSKEGSIQEFVSTDPVYVSRVISENLLFSGVRTMTVAMSVLVFCSDIVFKVGEDEVSFETFIDFNLDYIVDFCIKVREDLRSIFGSFAFIADGVEHSYPHVFKYVVGPGLMGANVGEGTSYVYMISRVRGFAIDESD